MNSTRPDASAIRDWSMDYLAKLLKEPREHIDPDHEFDALGLDSSSAIAFITSLEEWLHVELMPELIFRVSDDHHALRSSVHAPSAAGAGQGLMSAGSTLREREGEKYGGSAEGIRGHYDVGNAFWPLVLGPTMAYSCALFAAPKEDLDTAQRRKLQWHLQSAAVFEAKAALDIGCGWGSMLRMLSSQANVEHATGLTLSDAQAEYLEGLQLPKVETRLENWANHSPRALYDSIISIGAFEHFAKREETTGEKISVYRDFFEHCHRWLSPSGRMSLQTIAFGEMAREAASPFMNEIFPDSDLPYLSEIVAATEGLFEIVALRNDRIHYAITTECWARNLSRNRAAAVRESGEAHVERMLRYFKLVAMGFRMGKQQLLRIALRPINRRWSVRGSEYWTPPGEWPHT